MEIIIPVILFLVFLCGIRSRAAVFDDFSDGVMWGLKTAANIFPVILAVSVAASMMRASGLFDALFRVLLPITSRLGVPPDILPLALIRPVSGGGALGILSDILKTAGPDSFSGFCASVIMGSTETTFYTLSVYFKNTSAKNNNIILPAALFGDIVGIITGVWVSWIIF